MFKNDIFESQNDHFWSFFKGFSLLQNFIFRLAAPYSCGITVPAFLLHFNEML